MPGKRNPRNEVRILNANGTSNKRSQDQVGPLRNTASDAKH